MLTFKSAPIRGLVAVSLIATLQPVSAQSVYELDAGGISEQAALGNLKTSALRAHLLTLLSKTELKEHSKELRNSFFLKADDFIRVQSYRCAQNQDRKYSCHGKLGIEEGKVHSELARLGFNAQSTGTDAPKAQAPSEPSTAMQSGQSAAAPAPRVEVMQSTSSAPTPPAVTDEKTASLFAAVRAGQEAQALALIEQVADINARDQEQRTALIYAIYGHYNDFSAPLIEALLKAGADPNLQDLRGLSALGYALGSKQLSLIKRLVRAGGDLKKAASVKVGEQSIYDHIMQSSDPVDYRLKAYFTTELR